ncbi:MAG: YitT family protein [Ginsengibacter sp.]
MNNSITQYLIHTLLGFEKSTSRSKYRSAKYFFNFKIAVRHFLTSIFFISCGILSAGFGLKSFLLPNRFIDGGATGIALLVAGLTNFQLPFLLILINIPFVFLGLKVISKTFAIKAALAIAGLAICTAIIPYPEVTHDKLLVAVFGGFFLGAGIGFAVRGGAVIDGTEVLAIFLSKKFRITIGDVILVFNIMIFSVVAYLLSIETALYSILTYLAASKTVDFVIEGIEEYTGVTIVSHKAEAMRLMIIQKIGRGVTVYQGKRGFGTKGENKGNMEIIYTVITRLEVNKLSSEIEKIDPEAFVVMSSVKDTRGGMIKKRPLK